MREQSRDQTLQRLLQELGALRASNESLSAEVLQLLETVTALELACAHQREAYDLAPIACLTLDRHGAIHNVNRRALALLRFTKQQLEGVPLRSLLTPAFRRRFLEHVLACRKSADPLGFEAAVMKHGCEPFPVRLSLRWTEEAGGTYAVAMVDLSERDAALASCERLVQATGEANLESQEKDRLITMLSRRLGAPLGTNRSTHAPGRTYRTRLPARRHRRLRLFR